MSKWNPWSSEYNEPGDTAGAAPVPEQNAPLNPNPWAAENRGDETAFDRGLRKAASALLGAVAVALQTEEEEEDCVVLQSAFGEKDELGLRYDERVFRDPGWDLPDGRPLASS